MLDDHSPRKSAYHPGKVRVRCDKNYPDLYVQLWWHPLKSGFRSEIVFFDLPIEKSGPCEKQIPCAGISHHWSSSSTEQLISEQKESAWLWFHSIAREMLDKASISCPYSVMFWYLPFSGYICLSFSLSPSALFSTSLLPNTFCSQQNMKTHLSPLDNSTDNQENTFQYDGVSGRMNV